MATKLFDVDKLCERKTAGGAKSCKEREKNGSSTRLGELGILDELRCAPYKGRRGANTPEYAGARKSLGTASATGRPTELVGYYVQAHHMISKKEYADVWEHARRAGWDIDNAGNCLLMPKYCGYQMWEYLQYHRGNHNDAYFDRIKQELEKITDKYPKSTFCDEAQMKQMHADFHKLEDKLFKLLRRGSSKLPLYDISERAYGRDYKDEMGRTVKDAEGWMNISPPYRRKESHYYKKKTMPLCPYSPGGKWVPVP
jgi:hypothetical protein